MSTIFLSIAVIVLALHSWALHRRLLRLECGGVGFINPVPSEGGEIPTCNCMTVQLHDRAIA